MTTDEKYARLSPVLSKFKPASFLVLGDGLQYLAKNIEWVNAFIDITCRYLFATCKDHM